MSDTSTLSLETQVLPELSEGASKPAAPEEASLDATSAPTAQEISPAKPSLTPAQCAEQLKARFPALFAGQVKPLKLRIQVDIQERAPGVFSKQALSAFFRRHTGSTSYLIAVSKAPHRIDLDGQPAGEVSAEHREAAVLELTRRRELSNARREQEEKSRRERASLLRDFQQTTLTRPNFCALKGVAPEALDALLAQAEQEAQLAREAALQNPSQRPSSDGHRGGPRPADTGRRAGPSQHRGPRTPSRSSGA